VLGYIAAGDGGVVGGGDGNAELNPVGTIVFSLFRGNIYYNNLKSFSMHHFVNLRRVCSHCNPSVGVHKACQANARPTKFLNNLAQLRCPLVTPAIPLRASRNPQRCICLRAALLKFLHQYVGDFLGTYDSLDEKLTFLPEKPILFDYGLHVPRMCSIVR
jgi:hypothetical protein